MVSFREAWYGDGNEHVKNAMKEQVYLLWVALEEDTDVHVIP